MRYSAYQVHGVPERRRGARIVSAGRPGRARRASGTADVRALADELGSALVQAVRRGVANEPVSVGTGDGAPLGRAAPISWYAFALEYLGMRWPQIAAKTRNETNDALCAITQAMLRDMRGRPSDDLLRRALRDWAFVVPRPESRGMPTDVRLALRWVAGASRPLTDLLYPAVMRAVLEALRLKQDGTVAAAETQRHKRMTLVNAVRYAIEQGGLRTDPMATVNWRIAKTVKQVDPRVVANPTQARCLLCAVSYVGSYRRARGRRLVGLFAGMYYAGLRPEEVVAVTLPDCVLPAEGWGKVNLHIADLCPAVQGAGLPGGDVVGVQNGAELGGHGRMVEELGDEFHLVLGAAGGVSDVQPGVGVLGVLVGQFHGEACGFIGGDDAFGGRRHLGGGPVDRGEEVDVVADPVDDLMGLDGVAACQGVTEVVGERVEPDADQSAVQLVHYAAAALGASSGKRSCQAVRVGEGRNRSIQCRRRRPTFR